jgi:NitT/TauT family transport system ATP-binding protein
MRQDGVIVQLDRVSKEFHQGENDVRALEHVSLSVKQGEFVAIVGASGCGKSTLLNIIANLIEPTEGKVERAPQVAARGGIGMVFQNPVLLPWRNVLSNVVAPAEIYKIDKTTATSRAKELLSLVDLREQFHRSMPYQLSGGMQQRVAICRALLSDPPLLLMDEPFGALDALTRERMNLELQRIFMSGSKTVLLVTHSVDEAVFLSDRIVCMTPRPGRIAEIIQNELPRPRRVETYEDPLFIDYSAHVRKLIMATEPQMAADGPPPADPQLPTERPLTADPMMAA